MAVKIRLARIGKANQPLYRLIAVDEGKKRSGSAIEILGTYNPHKITGKLEIKKDRVDYWLSVGARPTETVAHLLQNKNSKVKMQN